MGIRKKIIFFVLCGYILISALSFILIHYYLTVNVEREYEERIKVIGDNLVTLIKSPLFYSDYNLLFDKIKTVQLDQFDYFLVYDNISHSIAFNNSRIMGNDYVRKVLEEKGQKDWERRKVKHKNEKYLEHVISVKIQEEVIGQIFIGVSNTKLYKHTREYSRILIGFSVIALLGFVFFILIFTRKIVSPIQRLRRKMQDFASGDLGARADIDTGDEIQQLADNFNLLAQEITAQMDHVKKESFDLQKEVSQRDKDLLDASLIIEQNESKIKKMEILSSLNSMVYQITHHINNPLTVIQGNIQMLENKIEDPDIQKRLNKISTYADKISTLIDDISIFSNIKNATSITFTVIDFLKNLCPQVVPEDYNLRISGNKELRIFTDCNLLFLSLKNILLNAVEIVEFRKKEKEILIEYFTEGSVIVFEVSDKGGGIENISRIFEPFYTTFERNKGLGLSYVFHISRILDGSITAQNTIEGARFVFKIPVIIT